MQQRWDWAPYRVAMRLGPLGMSEVCVHVWVSHVGGKWVCVCLDRHSFLHCLRQVLRRPLWLLMRWLLEFRSLSYICAA